MVSDEKKSGERLRVVKIIHKLKEMVLKMVEE
jgi:hypothetical protein